MNYNYLNAIKRREGIEDIEVKNDLLPYGSSHGITRNYVKVIPMTERELIDFCERLVLLLKRELYLRERLEERHG